MTTLTEPSRVGQNEADPNELFAEGVWRMVTSQSTSWITFRRPIPHGLVRTYAKQAARCADLRQYDDGSWFAEIISIDGFHGVWANEQTRDQTLDVLEEVIEDWVYLKLADQDLDIPVVNTLDLNVI